jgi:predicted transcriptional regulator
MYDSPNFHRLSTVSKEELLDDDLLDSLDQLAHPSVQSGDFMQAIEHVHAIICQKWCKERFREGLATDVSDREAELMKVFYETISPESVQANMRKLWELLQYVVQNGTGDYGPPHLS